jgi:hypothetical protein
LVVLISVILAIALVLILIQTHRKVYDWGLKDGSKSVSDMLPRAVQILQESSYNAEGECESTKVTIEPAALISIMNKLGANKPPASVDRTSAEEVARFYEKNYASVYASVVEAYV